MATTETPPVQDQAPAAPGDAKADVQASIQGFKATLKAWLPSVVIAIVVVLGITAYRTQRQSKVEQASRMLGAARSAQHLQELLTQYPSTPAAPLALLGVAKGQFDAGDYVLASSTYADFGTKYGKHPLAAVARLGKIHCQEAMGQTAEALASYTSFATNETEQFLIPLAKFGQARCLEQQHKFEEAKAVYEDYLAANPDTPWRPDVEQALTALKRQMRKPMVKL